MISHNNSLNDTRILQFSKVLLWFEKKSRGLCTYITSRNKITLLSSLQKYFVKSFYYVTLWVCTKLGSYSETESRFWDYVCNSCLKYFTWNQLTAGEMNSQLTKSIHSWSNYLLYLLIWRKICKTSNQTEKWVKIAIFWWILTEKVVKTAIFGDYCVNRN